MPEILEKAFQLALGGDKTMLKLLLELHMSKNIQKDDESTDRPKVQIVIKDLTVTSEEDPAPADVSETIN